MKKTLTRFSDIFKMSEKEHGAAITALNIFFGAVIGVSLGNIDAISTKEYILLLMVTSAFVMSILFVSYSHRKVLNAILAVLILGLAWGLDAVDKSSIDFPPKLLPTLGVWLFLSIVNELWKRSDEPAKD